MKCSKCKTEYEGTCCPNCGNLTPPPVLAEDKKSPVPLYVLLGVGGIVLLGAAVVVMTLYAIFSASGQEREQAHTFSRLDHIPEAFSQAEVADEMQAAEKEYDPDADRQAKLEWQQSKGVYDSGDYEVGADIPEGTYLILSDGEGYGDFYCGIYASPSMSNESKIYGGWAQNSMYVILEEGQYIHFSHASLYDAEKSEIVQNPFLSSGMFRVGYDVEPGTYTIVSSDEQYSGDYTIYSTLTSSGGMVREGSHIEPGETAEVTLAEGEYLEMKFCMLEE